MSKLFLENTEGKLHAKTKNKLFQLLIESKVIIIDNNGVKYDIFPQINSTEFLHMESFTINYKNNAVYSDDNLSCGIELDLEMDKAGSNCDYQANYGICWELPCRKCIEDNYKGKKNSIGFIPDIAYGYNNKYKIWIEVCDKHPSTDTKIQFCMKNDIILLEVRAIDVELLNNNNNAILTAINLTYKPYQDSIAKILLQDIVDNMKNGELFSYEYITEYDDYFSYFFRNIIEQMLNKYINIDILFYTKDIETFFKINKGKYEELDNGLMFFGDKNKIQEYIQNIFNNQFNEIVNDINKNGYSLYSKTKDIFRKFLSVQYNIKDFRNYLEEKGYEILRGSKIATQKYNVVENKFPWIIVKKDVTNSDLVFNSYKLEYV